MKIPQGFPNEGKVCKLLKSLYSLKQAPLRWNTKFTEILKENGLIPLRTDPCLFKAHDGKILLGDYVDDRLLIGEDRNQILNILKNLQQKFKMTSEENPKSFVGIEITQTKEGILLGQTEFAKTVVEKYNMENSKPCNTPLLLNSKDTENRFTHVPIQKDTTRCIQ